MFMMQHKKREKEEDRTPRLQQVVVMFFVCLVCFMKMNLKFPLFHYNNSIIMSYRFWGHLRKFVIFSLIVRIFIYIFVQLHLMHLSQIILSKNDTTSKTNKKYPTKKELTKNNNNNKTCRIFLAQLMSFFIAF